MTISIKLKVFALMSGVLLGAGVARAERATTELSQQDIAIGTAAFAEYVSQSASAIWPMLDITSIPTHAIVAFEQDFLNIKTQMETEAKKAVQGAVAGEATETMPTLWGMGPDRMVGNVMSDVKITVEGVKDLVGEGVVGVSDTVTKAGEQTTHAITVLEQRNYTSSAGSMAGKEEYMKTRSYTEQEQAIRMLTQAVIVRKNVAEKVPAVVQEMNRQYQSAIKGDLASGGGESANNENVAWRQYAAQGLAYDQLLSLEQQILGLRLQAKGGSYEQKLKPLRDQLDVKGSS